MKTGRTTLIVAGVLAGLVACGSFVPREGWHESYGPVVPHDTFPADCALCHEGGSWDRIRDDFAYDHLAETGVELVGAHAEAQCLLCHNDRGPAGVAAAKGCAGCHEDVHRGRLGADCTQCHNESTWQPVGAIHEHSFTRFPLVGPHAAAQCFQCHPGAQVGNFEGLSPDCVFCHQDDLARAVSPNHADQGWTDDCQRCHVELGWVPAYFDHPASFQLVGGHSARDCNDCHTPGTYAGLDTDCASCHLDTFNQTTSPNHASAGFGTDCQQCHTVFGWGGANFVHPASFPLSGGHNLPDCIRCHQGGVFVGTPTDCVACHLNDYNATSGPNHAALGFSTDCASCHDTFDWGNANFTHPASFPLSGGHNVQDCAQCHQGGVFMGTPTDCVACHLNDYNGTTDPNHAASGFSTDCASCHDTFDWGNANFTHPASFPLSGGHNVQDCAQCHQGGVFVGTPTDCVACHLNEYNTTTNPNHAQSGFSTDCMVCHDTIDWRNATFNHSFDITGSPHGSLDCIDCHTVPAAMPAFGCTHCHDHRQSEALDEHSSVDNFVWADPNCFSCHMSGH